MKIQKVKPVEPEFRVLSRGEADQRGILRQSQKDSMCEDAMYYVVIMVLPVGDYEVIRIESMCTNRGVAEDVASRSRRSSYESEFYYDEA